MKRKGLNKGPNPAIHLFFIFWCVICLIPFLIVVSASFTSKMDLAKYGYTVFPKTVSLEAYKFLLAAPQTILNAYKSTAIVTVCGTVLSLIVDSLMAYALSRKGGTRLGKFLTYFIYIPTLIGGGLTPSYIINTRYLGLTDSLLVLFIPGLVHVFNIFMIRTFINQQPKSLMEAAKLDGANEYGIYFHVALPIAKPALATVGFNLALGYWNSWYNSMIYIRTNSKMTLQHLLQRMLGTLQQFMAEMQAGLGPLSMADIPGENLRMAMLVVAIGPMMFLFPFFQKYFVKGMVVGSVKG